MKLSVVMPTLNSGRKIKGAIDSLAAQTIKDAELIVVDSGSKDDTIDILNTYKHDDMPVIRILSAPDCSPALARNVGIKNAVGDYIAFCDSDDIMKPDMLTAIYSAAVRTSADITVCDFDMLYPERTIKCFSKLSNDEFNPSANGIVDYYFRFSAAPKPNNYVWSRLYGRDFLKRCGVLFPNTRYSEDNLFNLSLLLKEPKITHIGQSLYSYVQHDDSAMRTHIRCINHGLLFLESFRNAADLLRCEDESISEPILAIYAFTRVRSILFYAWQAGLHESDSSSAVAVFTADETVKSYISICLDKDYIGRYCRLHSYSPKWEETIRSMLLACLGRGAMPDMKEVFA